MRYVITIGRGENGAETNPRSAMFQTGDQQDELLDSLLRSGCGIFDCDSTDSFAGQGPLISY